jgi:hypothetical protein
MTVQDLLRHTAGLTYGELTQNPAVRDALAKAGLFKPGHRFRRSGHDGGGRGGTSFEKCPVTAESPTEEISMVGCWQRMYPNKETVIIFATSFRPVSALWKR